MVIAFDENTREAIESIGLQVVEFKRVLYEITDDVDNIVYAWKICKEPLIKAINDMSAALGVMIPEILNELNQVIASNYWDVKMRYKMVKNISKYTNMDIDKAKQLIRHRPFRIRSNC